MTFGKAIFVAAAVALAGGSAAVAQTVYTGPGSYQQIGPFTYGSNGSTYQQIGNFGYGNDGTTTQRIGNFTYIHTRDGRTVTCQQIGSQTYCN